MKRIIIASTALLLTGLAHAAAPKPAPSTALAVTTSTTAATAAAASLATAATAIAPTTPGSRTLAEESSIHLQKHWANSTVMPTTIASTTQSKPHGLVAWTTQFHTSMAGNTVTTPAHAAFCALSNTLYTHMPDVVSALKAKPETQRLHDLLDQAGTVSIAIATELKTAGPVIGQLPEVTKLMTSLQELVPLFKGAKECQNCSGLQKQLLASLSDLIKAQKDLAASQAQVASLQAQLRAAPESSWPI